MLVQSTPSFNKDIGKLKDDKMRVRVEQIIERMQSAENISDIKSVKKVIRSIKCLPDKGR